MAKLCAICNEKLLTEAEQGNASHTGECRNALMNRLLDALTEMSSAELHNCLTRKSYTDTLDEKGRELTNDLIDASLQKDVNLLNVGTDRMH